MMMMTMMTMMTMMKRRAVQLLVFFIAVNSHCCIGSVVKIEVTKHYQDGVIPNAFNIRCTPEVQRSCAKTIIAMQVTKGENQIIANIKGGDIITSTPLLEAIVRAEGHIDADFGKTFLSVTVTEAVEEDSGRYSCDMFYLDEAMLFQKGTDSEIVKITNQNSQDLIKYFMSKISFLENLIKFQEEELSNVKTTLVDQGRELDIVKTQFPEELSDIDTSLVQRLQNRLSNATATLENQGRQLNYVKTTLVNQGAKLESVERNLAQERNKLQEVKADVVKQGTTLVQQGTKLRDLATEINQTDDAIVHFKACCPWDGKFSFGDVIVYTQVSRNDGDGYNPTSGIFTAPIAGYYLFHLAATALHRNYADIDLTDDKDHSFTRLFIGDSNGWEENGQRSIVLKLQAGAVVKPVLTRGSGDFKIFKANTQLNFFSGFLLRAI